MYLEAVFSFYMLINHLIGNSLFQLVCCGSLGDIIKQHFALSLVELHFYVDYAIRFFVGKHYNRFHMFRLPKKQKVQFPNAIYGFVSLEKYKFLGSSIV